MSIPTSVNELSRKMLLYLMTSLRGQVVAVQVRAPLLPRP